MPRKNKQIRKIKYIKDEAIVNFLLQHSESKKIDFSKIKIPSFFDDCNDSNENTTTQSALEQVHNNEQKPKQLPVFGLNLFNELKNDGNQSEDHKFSSSIFK